MRRTEALQGVRMIKFLDILGRYEALKFNQLKAAELLGVGERTFRRWYQRYEEDGGAGCWTGGRRSACGKALPPRCRTPPFSSKLRFASEAMGVPPVRSRPLLSLQWAQPLPNATSVLPESGGKI
jgi:hypothetical protein